MTKRAILTLILCLAITPCCIQAMVWGPDRIWAAWNSQKGMHTLELKWRVIKQILWDFSD